MLLREGWLLRERLPVWPIFLSSHLLIAALPDRIYMMRVERVPRLPHSGAMYFTPSMALFVL